MGKLPPEKEQLKTDELCCCGEGVLHAGFTEITSKVDGVDVVIKNVPALVCDKCDEAYITPEVSHKIDKIMEEFYSGKLRSKPLVVSEVAYTLASQRA
jgi:YgiT-type zinc finger domain-containing protein